LNFACRSLLRACYVLSVAAFAGCSSAATLGSAPAVATAPILATSRSGASAEAARIVRTVSAAGFGGTRVTFEHSLICDNGILIAAYAAHYGISTIYVPVTGDDISSLLNRNPTTVKNFQAMLAVARVYLVAGDVTWLATPAALPPDVASLARIATMFPKVAGILYAFDPEGLAAWNSSQRPALITAYFALIATIQTSPSASAFAASLFLAHTDYGKIASGGKPAAPTMIVRLQASPKYGGTVLIVAGGSETAQVANLSAVLPQLTQPFTIESSSSPYGGNSYYGQSASYLAANQTQLAQAVTALNPELTGTEVNGWNDLYNGLMSILPQPPVFTGALATGRLVPPPGTTYLGGYVNPAGGGSSAAQTAAFESQIGRPLAYDMHFYGWTNPFPGPSEADDVAHGRIPLVAWNCGDSDARVAAGDDDANIIRRAKAIKAFGAPIIVRWFWEMNLDDTNNAPRTQCYDPVSDLPAGYFAPGPYLAAWAHIRSVFASQGVTNVVWLWCVANAHGGPAQYYPGDAAVDWVGMDDYDTNDVSLHDTFFILAEELSQFQEKPFMITETGAHAANQVAFTTGADSELQSAFPWVRGVGYLDSTGNFQTWTLSAAGLSSFVTFAQSPYMAAMESSAAVR
jgi:hypothetical protein